MKSTYVFIVLVTNSEQETWVDRVCDSEETARVAMERVKLDVISEGICDTAEEVEQSYFIRMHCCPVESLADLKEE